MTRDCEESKATALFFLYSTTLVHVSEAVMTVEAPLESLLECSGDKIQERRPL